MNTRLSQPILFRANASILISFRVPYLKPVLEQFPRLTLAGLRKAGALALGRSAIVDLENSDLALRAMIRGRESLELSWSDGEQSVALSWSTKNHGAAAYLTCPRSGRRSRALFLVNGEFVSREAAGLTYLSTSMSWQERRERRVEKVVERLEGNSLKGPARGAVREGLLNELRQSPDLLGPAAHALLDADEEWKRRKRRRRPRTTDPAMGTRLALHFGRKRGSRLSSATVLSFFNFDLEPGVPDWPTDGLKPLAVPAGIKGDAPELDVRRIRPRRGLPRGYKLSWGVTEERVRALAVVNEPAGVMRLEIWSADGGTMIARQSIALVHGRRRGDLFCICPVTGRRCVKLYLRGGRFASAETQKLR